MSRIPEDCPKISTEFQKRLIELISDEEINDKVCSNTEFANRVGIDKNIISKVANYGIIPSVKSLVKIADYLNVSLDYLLCRTDNPAFTASDCPATFHNRLLQLKEENHMKFSDITNKTSFSRNSIHVWLKRNNLPTLDYLFQLSKIFDVSPDYLLGRTDYRHNF